MGKVERPAAVVMNMFYTGLGIARSMGEHGIPVIGLSAHKGFCGNLTRYARVVSAPDSRSEPEKLLAFLLDMGKKSVERSPLFPTRDDDLVFLDRFRRELEPFFIPLAPEAPVLEACLNKWETFLWAKRAGVATPKCWLIEDSRQLSRICDEVEYPCVLKPVAAYQWRQGNNWGMVGGRKAFAVSSPQELLSEYASIQRAERRVLLQEMVPGGDECLVIVGCYLDRQSNWVAGFNAQKLLQVPEGFGTGCIVRASNHSELFAPTMRLLQQMRFTGMAEVEYKWDTVKREYLLIEINPRPWDQHRLGVSCGTDLAYFAYCGLTGAEMPPIAARHPDVKWIADDVFLMTALRMLWRRDPKLGALFRLARGRRIYGICSVKDPLPALALIGWLLRQTFQGAIMAAGRLAQRLSRRRQPKEALV